MARTSEEQAAYEAQKERIERDAALADRLAEIERQEKERK